MIDKSNLSAFLIGIGIGLSILVVIAWMNSMPCIKCGRQCSDSAIYCSKCGQQLRIVTNK